jgi:protein-disulfide isomerase
MGPILGWSLAFIGVAVFVVAAAIYLSQPGSGVEAPGVVTPADIPSDGRTLGVSNAPVTIDIYGDFRCSACKRFTIEGTEQTLVDNDVRSGRARFVWHDRLLIDQMSGGTASRDAANAAWCAADQGKFWTMHDWLYANSSEDPSSFTESRLSAIGKAAGLDMTAFQPCLDQGTHNAAIAAEDSNESTAINSTPTIFVGGKLVGNTSQVATYQQIKAAIDAAAAATPSPAPSPSPSPSTSLAPSPATSPSASLAPPASPSATS